MTTSAKHRPLAMLLQVDQKLCKLFCLLSTSSTPCPWRPHGNLCYTPTTDESTHTVGPKSQYRMVSRPARDLMLQVDFSFSPEPHIAFCPIFVHPFEEYAPELLLTFYLIVVQPSIFSYFEHFFEKVSESNSILHFGSFFVQPNPKLNPTT